ncbi:MAG: 4-alpha-glucanotransferase [Myxococcales bacterium]
MATDRWGIEDRFHDAFGVERVIGDDSRAEVLRAMGVDPDEPAPPPDDRLLRVVRTGERAAVGAGAELLLENGTGRLTVGMDGNLPPDLPGGYHTLLPPGAAQEPVHLIVSPGVCFLPDDLKTWGWAIQVYAARSRESWGMGDLADLRALGAWTRALGGGAVMINPLAAPAPVIPVEASPYYPSSRRFRNPLYLRIEEIPGADCLDDASRAELTRLGEDGRALNADRRIDRNRVMSLKLRALELLWKNFRGDVAFDDYRRTEGDALEEFAAYCALAERHGKDWRRWPSEVRHPTAPAVRQLISDEPRVRFHAWLQWLLDEQLCQASRDVKIINDLPVGFDIAGADGWCWQDMVVENISVGCPPDPFNLNGQDWGLAPFIPAKLRAAGYAPFIQTIRALLRHAGGLRIDHVMGLFRLFWIPRRLGPQGGTYVRYPAEELLAIVALESQRARAAIVGEDLGTVLPGTREILAAHRLLSYRLLFFEPQPPAQFPELALCSVTTHDLATIAGIWSGAAVGHARGAGVTPNEQGLAALKTKLAGLPGVVDTAPLEDVIVAIHHALAAAPSRILLATLDDALAVSEQPNMPGTTTSWPNWSLALPLGIEELQQAELPRRIAAALRRA